ncbi:hypothetical protein [Microcystis sp. MC19]|uniref:hypothetical protein n=1 Tax=Microcystis sp. MC19 TaxID=1967666 RepID=UPI0020B16A55|nr:hypothetical protein [Microcystis sp. MC19]
MDLKFEGLKFGKFIDKNNLSIDIDELIIIIKNHSQKLSLDEQQIKQDLSDALCKVLGTLNATDVKTHIPHPQLSQIKKAIKVVHNN